MTGRSRRPRRHFLPLTPEGTFGLLAVLLVAAFLMGGGSRADIASLSLLRAFACLAAALGVMGLDRATLRAWRFPFLLLVGLAALMALQLVPLPPSLWTQLPGREGIRQLDAAIGLADTWRPLTLSPMRTANSLASLTVPFAVLVLFCQLGERHRRQILVVLVALAGTSAVVGLLQMLAGADSGLYFYAVTHKGAAVGLFANRNHHTVFLASAILVALHLAMMREPPVRRPVSAAYFVVAILLLVAVIGNVSRAGLLSAGVALVLLPLVIPGREAAAGKPSRIPMPESRLARAGLFAVPALGILMLFAVSQRSPALSRLLADAHTEDARARILSELIAMARDVQPFGTGFGAFEYAYRMREPTDLLVENYFNHAHNDWLQLAIEGGIGAVVLLAAALAAIVVRIVGLVRDRTEIDLSRVWLGLAVLIVFGFGSLVDYPLRVPSIMAVATIAFALIVGPAVPHKRRNG